MDLGICDYETPMMIKVDNNSSNYNLTSYTDGVWFDISATGTPLRVGWTVPGSMVGFLALDRNGNGKIDNGSELFGTGTKMSNGQRARNGFEALVDLDGGTTGDGRIDVGDAFYADLRLWFDDNHDGVSQGSELLPLSDVGVSAIFTQYRETSRMDRHGNVYLYEGSATVMKNGKEKKHKVFDVSLITPATNE